MRDVPSPENHPAQPGLELPVLPQREDRFLSILEQMSAWVTEIDADGRTTYVSPTVRDVVGYQPDEVSADALTFHEDDLPTLLKLRATLRENGQPTRCTVRAKHKAGHWVWLETTALAWCPVPDGPLHSISLTRDVTEVVRANEALRESEERYAVVAEMSRDLISEVDAAGRVTYQTPAVSEITGYSLKELSELPPFEIIHPDDRDRLEQGIRDAVESETPVRIAPFRARDRAGNWIWFESTGHTYRRADGEVRLLTVTRDVTKRIREEQSRREFEDRMQRAQKLESLGVLAGGVAHDFNNLLTPILGAASLGLMELPDDSPVRARLVTIQQAAQRAAALTNQMLSYAGTGPLLVERLDLSHFVEEMGQLIGSAISGKAVLDFELRDDLPAVEADAAQLSQVVINMISNAAEALPDGTGQITVRTGVLDVAGPTSPHALYADELRDGPHVYFEVADTGCGMDAETRTKIFDPFFTTKFTGRGLGLAAVAGIVRGHRGAIEVESEPGEGTRFRVLLPASAVRAAAEVAPRPALDAWRSSGTALVIDDDEGVRELSQEVLSRAGLSVICAADGHTGVEIYRKHAAEIRVVLLDRTMPTSSGRETFEQIRAIRPDARVVLVSGYSEERATAELTGRGLSGFLKKPFLPETLLERVREVLDDPGGAE